MGLIRDFFSRSTMVPVGDLDCDAVTAEICLYELALENVASIIGNSLTQLKIHTYRQNERINGILYHTLNVKPNKNQNAADFRKKLARKLVFDNEALIVQIGNGDLFIADSFQPDDRVIDEKRYEQVVVDDVMFNRTFLSSDVLHIKLNNKKINDVLSCVYRLHGVAIKRALSQFYKQKGFFKIQSLNSYKDKTQEEIQDLFKRKVMGYFGNSDTSVMVLENGLEFVDNTENKAKIDDINGMIDKVYSIVFSAFGIPISFVKEATSTASTKSANANMDQYLTLCINPIATTLENEINAKYYSQDQYRNGSFSRVKTFNVKSNNPLDNASNIDILRRNGYSFDEIREFFNEEPLNEAWSKRRYITKNYEEIDQKE